MLLHKSKNIETNFQIMRTTLKPHVFLQLLLYIELNTNMYLIEYLQIETKMSLLIGLPQVFIVVKGFSILLFSSIYLLHSQIFLSIVRLESDLVTARTDHQKILSQSELSSHNREYIVIPQNKTSNYYISPNRKSPFPSKCFCLDVV